MQHAQMWAGADNLAQALTLSWTSARPQWLEAGWEILARLHKALEDVDEYRGLQKAQARREFLQNKIKRLDALDWKDLPEFWGDLGAELARHWRGIAQAEAEQAREWLRLQCSLSGQTLRTGRQALQLEIHNPTATLARKLLLQPAALPDWEWLTPEVRQNTLEGGDTTLLVLQFCCETAGLYEFQAMLRAEDLQGQVFELAVSAQLALETAGAPYQPLEIMPYCVGPGLGDNRLFAGRGGLLRELRGLWRQPGSKPAVVLIGQRRIGKTSLLQKIVRDAVADTQLLPVFLDVQGVEDAADFWASLYAEMRRVWEAQGMENHAAPGRCASFADFKAGLRDWPMQSRYFLLLLDEADWLPRIKNGERLPDFLRALMQGHEYPVLLLFCGTHALKRMGRDYQSFLFNTARVRTVSYLTETESAEVLQIPPARRWSSAAKPCAKPIA
ncbi:MAG: ATP-binding protein [Gammaproteobacteria bacterium]|nr:ATP-binding protein [Gammaproteobacteria bacterium]